MGDAGGSAIPRQFTSYDTNTSRKFVAETLDLAGFLENHIVNRSTHAGQKKRTVIMKMDIEGSEYSVLPRLLKKGLLCLDVVDTIYIEWHIRKAAKLPEPWPPPNWREVLDKV